MPFAARLPRRRRDAGVPATPTSPRLVAVADPRAAQPRPCRAAPRRAATPAPATAAARSSPPAARRRPGSPGHARPDPPQPLAPATAVRASRPQQVLQLLGLGALTSAVVAYAPYAGTALVADARAAPAHRLGHPAAARPPPDGPRSATLVRRADDHALDCPATCVLALFGAVSLVAVAGLAALAMFSLGYLLGQPVTVGLVLAGLGFTPALWWGPGSGRLREMTRGLVDAHRPTGVRRLVRGRDVPARHGRAARPAVQRRAQLGACTECPWTDAVRAAERSESLAESAARLV